MRLAVRKYGEVFSGAYAAGRRMPNSDHTRLCKQCPPPSLAVIAGGFSDYLRKHGLSSKRIYVICWAVRHVAGWYARRGRPLPPFRRRGLSAVISKSGLPAWRRDTRTTYREGLQWWLKFHGRYHKPEPTYPWCAVLDDYIEFLKTHRGLADRTRANHRKTARAFLKWEFGNAVPDWTRVKPQDIWRYAQDFRRERKPTSLNHELRQLRIFLKFLLMCGTPVARLIPAVPRFFNFGSTPQTQILTDPQRAQLLSSFDRRSAREARDHCMVLCMVDLGLRPQETVRLSLSDIDWKKRSLRVPATKGDRDRYLPLPSRIATALRQYIHKGRLPAACEALFIRDGKRGAGLPMQIRHLQWALMRAYRRCGFPKEWCGGYRLRHTFASRLHARGADLKQIADLLGHRHLQTTTLYAKVDLNGLRALALSWPL